MKLAVAGVRASGRALDLRGRDVDPHRLLTEIRDPDSRRVVCRRPGPAHRHVGHLNATADRPNADALAAVAASRDLEPSAGAQPTDAAAERRAVAAATADVIALRERVERASGRLEALRDIDAETDEAAADLRQATLELTDAETERVAAEQRLNAAETRLRRERDQRERGLRRADARRNHPERRTSALAERARPLVERAHAAVPGWNPGALAAARAARLSAPVVVENGPFRHPGQAAACLDAPVILL
ncbi:hypothetical protein [Salarchaeum sp. JOR-1]|uniref:DUF7856 family protein n=1 Tax=Salarchaeum sp. JOR-1 TaxID=2599399 RepID=UPI0011988932|nr:hypothetical protein [Salarchaeum sp. JOR-1]QDX40342.1 hypothetical protein FQU85_05305 [Salarchaeum sp. JOR-1]